MLTQKTYSLFKWIPAILLFMGCHSFPKDVRQVSQPPAIWPDYTEVTIPANIAPLDFAMADDDVETIDVIVKGSKGGELHANGSYADFDVDEWHQLLQANKGGQLTFTVCAEKDGQWTQYRDFQVFVSNEEMDAWGQTGETHPIDEVNSSRTESLHNWTPNSHWFLFTSRRDDGLYTRIYFSSLDSNGKATKPFLLPQRNPKEYYCQSLYSYNTPDFSIRPITPHGHELGRQIESDKRVETQIIRK